METPYYIENYEQKEGVLSRSKVVMPKDFDNYLKDKKMELVYSESSTDFETGKTIFS